MLKGIYCEPTLGKAFQKLEEEFTKYAETREAVQPTKAIPDTAKPVKPTPPPKVMVKKDEWWTLQGGRGSYRLLY